MEQEDPTRFPEHREQKFSLPETIDNEGTIFSYGYLLDIQNLQNLLSATRGEHFQIVEVQNISEADKKASENPNAVVILHNVCLEGVRVSVLHEAQLRDLLAKEATPYHIKKILEDVPIEQKNQLLGGRAEDEFIMSLFEQAGDPAISKKNIKDFYFQYLRMHGITQEKIPDEPREHAFLYAQAAKEGERGRFLNGGLIIGLNREEVKKLVRYEFWPVYELTHTPSLKLHNQEYAPKHITFFAAQPKEPHTKETRNQTQKILKKQDTKKWPPDVRRTTST